MTDAETAYKAAQTLIAEAIESGLNKLDFSGEEFRALETIPPEIAKLKGLSRLDMDNTKVSDFSPLKTLSGLTSLFISDTNVNDISALQDLQKLQNLHLGGLDILDFEPLLLLDALRILVLDRTNIVDLSPLTALSKLERLHLDNTQVEDLKPLENLGNLSIINFLKASRIKDLRPLLQSMLSARNNKIDGREIDIDGTSALAGDPNLQKIYDIAESDEARFDAVATYLESLPNPVPDREDIKGLRSEVLEVQSLIGAEADALAKIRTETAAMNKGLDAARERLKAFEIESEKQIKDAKEDFAKSMEAAEEAFNEGAATAAPVELWKEKEAEHVGIRDTAVIRFYIGLAFITLVALISIWMVVSGNIDSVFVSPSCNPKTPESCANVGAKGLMIAGGLLTLFTALLWFTRLQLKLYLAERHMQMDARERRAFAQTYIGFLKEGDASADAKEQRGLVYAALFRPSSDGTVKDEGGMDPSVASAISKFLAK